MVVPGDGDGDVAGGGVGGPWNASEGPGGGAGGLLPGLGVGVGGVGGTPVGDGDGACWRRLRRNPRDKTSSSPICCEFEFRAGAEASAMSLMKKQKQARATARTPNERRPAAVAIVVGGGEICFLRSSVHKIQTS